MELDFNIFKKGRVLVSEPFLQDTYFKRSLVLLTEHSDEGAVGFVLNKPLEVKVNEVMNDFPISLASVSIGGPVSTNTIHYLHTLGDLIPNSVHVMDNIYWGGDFDTIKNMVRAGEISSEHIRFFLGYSGWHAGQLENELEQNSWLVTEIKSSLIMKPNTNIWKNTLSQLGEKYRIWANFPENPSLN